jgi:zinc protease
MAFNGTRNFPKQDIVVFMQALSMRFGAHVNAHTSFDETVYELQIPTGNPAVLDQSLTILEDFARDVSFIQLSISYTAINMVRISMLCSIYDPRSNG